MRTMYRRRPSTIMPSSPVCPRPFTRHGTKSSFATALYDFKERVLRSPISVDRMGFHAKATSEMWQPSKATKLFEHILAFLKEHLETGVCLLEASENGKQVIECFEELEQDGCEILRHMKVYGDWDSVLYELRLMTRAISATPRFCEMYYIWESQDSGKDTKVKMLHAAGLGQ